MRCLTRLAPRSHRTAPSPLRGSGTGSPFSRPSGGSKGRQPVTKGAIIRALVDAIWTAILDSHPMDSQGGPSMRPRVTGSNHPLPFGALSPREFERLCHWLVCREGYENVEWLGASGRDKGRDVVAWRDGVRVVFQCKRVKAFRGTDAEKEIEKLRALPVAQQPGELIFVVSCDVSADTREAARAAVIPGPVPGMVSPS